MVEHRSPEPTRRPPPPPLSPSTLSRSYDSSLGVKDCVFVITGGTGYLGRILTRRLLAGGAREVRTFDTSAPAVDSAADGDPRVVRICGDVRDGEAVLAACAGVDCIFHIASYGMSGREMVNRAKTREVNVGGTRTVIQAAVEAGVPRLVFTSTYNTVYGGRPIEGGDEILPYFPVEKHLDEYSRTKALAEMEVLHADGRMLLGGQGGKLSTCAIRPAAIYGPGEERHFPRIASVMQSGAFLFCIGSKDTLVDWVHGESLADAHVRAAIGLRTGITAGQAYFISDGKPVNQFAFLEPLAAALGLSVPSVYVPVWALLPVAVFIQACCAALLRAGIYVHPPLLPAEVYKVGRTHWFRIDKARRDMGYEPLVDSKQGMEETVRALLKRMGQGPPRVTRPNLIWWLLIGTGLLLLGASAFGPRKLPTEILLVRRLGVRIFGSVQNLKVVWWLAWLAHAAESFVAWKIARANEPSNTLGWTLQTFVLGYPSLRLLKGRYPRRA